MLLIHNLKIGNTPSNLRIVDYSHGFTGSAHDASAFEYTAAFRHAEWFFQGHEFAWVDSAYPLTSHCIAVHKKPGNLKPENIIFDKQASNICVRSEHCMGALKGHFQCLKGLRVQINSNTDHIKACQWITAAIILHNLIIDTEGMVDNLPVLADEDRGVDMHMEDDGINIQEQQAPNDEEHAGEEKRAQLTNELIMHYSQM